MVRISSNVPGQPPISDSEIQKESDAVKAEPQTDARQPDAVPNESRSRTLKSELSLSGNLQQSQLSSQPLVLGQGSRGPEVEKLQDFLIASGHMTEAQKNTGPGVFGPQTEAALKAFQRERGLKADGIFGPETQKETGGEVRDTHKLQQATDKKTTNPEIDKRAEAIHQACEGIGTDEQAIFKNLEGLGPQQRKELEKTYQQKFGVSLENELRSELSGKDLEKALALLKRNQQKSGIEMRADAIREACEGVGTDEQAIFKNLEGLSPQQRNELEKTYQQKFGVSLENELRSELSGKDLEKALALLKGSPPKSTMESRADAIHKAFAGLGTDEEAIFKNLQGLSTQQRKELQTIYQQKFGVSLEDELRSELSGTELEKALSLLKGQAPSKKQDGGNGLETEHVSRRERRI
jgi:peptidoglycan hydrolase-like protein with peptidoglycan-binding domain